MTRANHGMAALDWQHISQQLDAQGHAHLPELIPAALAAELAAAQQPSSGLQLTLHEQQAELMQMQHLQGVLPEALLPLNTMLYGHLQVIAQRWLEIGTSDNVSAELPQSNRQSAANTPTPATPQQSLLLSEPPHPTAAAGPLTYIQRISAGGHQDLQQSSPALCSFPLAMAAVLNSPGTDFSGGEWVFVEQRPRMQSRPMVVQPQRGDVVIFSIAPRPLRSATGHTRAQLKHGISRVHRGVRIGLQVFFERGNAA